MLIKDILLFSSGAAIGAALSMHFWQKKYAAELEDEVERQVDSILNNMEEKKKEDQEKEKEETRSAKKEKVKYDQMTKVYKEEEHTEEEETQEDIAASYEHPEDSDELAEYPYQISEEEFNEKNGYEKESLYYYAGDGSIVNDMDALIEDVDAEAMLGREYLGWLNGTDAVYIRNEKLQTDYELVWNSSSYPV